MFDINKMEVRKHVPYVEMIVSAEKTVKNICTEGANEILTAAGSEYMYYASLVSLFTNISVKEFEDDIDGFMDSIYSGSLHELIEAEANLEEIKAFDRAVRLGIERYYSKTQLERLIENANSVLESILALVNDKGEMHDLLGKLIGTIGGEATK